MADQEWFLVKRKAQWLSDLFLPGCLTPAMATASVTAEADDKECPVCHELFTDPKLLPCGHLLCRHCLISWLQSKAEAHCPLCRCVIADLKERTGGKSLEDIADGFPTDLAMTVLVESQQLLSKDQLCQFCVTQSATALCLNCNDLLCSNCAFTSVQRNWFL